MMARALILAAALALAQPATASAQDLGAAIVSQLRTQGFDEVRLTRTLLGRTRIEAESETHRREIIVNPRTGEILRDFWIVKRGGGGAASLFDPREDDDDDDDDRDDDDRDDDRDDDDDRDRDDDGGDDSDDD